MKSALLCASHSPLLYCYVKPPRELAKLERVLEQRARAIKEFEPELVIVFGSDHFNGFFLKTMPAFCIGLQAKAEEDIGGFSGRLDVPEETAIACIESARRDNVDVAVSYSMLVDHAFSQTIQLALGGLTNYPLVPVFINCLSKPYVPFRRSRKLGEAIGKFAKNLDRKVLFLASGGMSHHPARYYPAHGEGEKEVEGWKLSGGEDSESMNREAWLERLHTMHHEGARMIANGERTAEDMRLNEEVDKHFLDLLCHKDLQEFDEWEPEKLVEQAGIGFLELQTWIAATAAYRVINNSEAVCDIYTLAPEIGIAAGIVHAG